MVSTVNFFAKLVLPTKCRSLSGLNIVGIVYMQTVEQPVGRRGQNDADIGNEGHPAENGVGRREQLAAHIGDLDHRAHTTQDHGGIVNRIDPGNVCAIVVTHHPYGQAHQ